MSATAHAPGLAGDASRFYLKEEHTRRTGPCSASGCT
jgi:hypothetical protein